MPQTIAASARHVAGRLVALLCRFSRETGGQDLLEYALLAGFVGIAGFAALSALGPTVGNTYGQWLTRTSSIWEPEPPGGGS